MVFNGWRTLNIKKPQDMSRLLYNKSACPIDIEIDI